MITDDRTSHEDDSSRSEPLLCPRCGYDQQGIMPTWVESCPLQLTCTECGLEFDTAPALRAELRMLPWFIECVPWSLGWLIAWVRTCVMILLPWLFWKRVRMALEVRKRPILAAILLVLVAATLIAAVGYSVAVVRTYKSHTQVMKQYINSNLETARWRVAMSDGDVGKARDLVTQLRDKSGAAPRAYYDQILASIDSGSGAVSRGSHLYKEMARIVNIADSTDFSIKESAGEALFNALCNPMSTQPLFTVHPAEGGFMTSMSPRDVLRQPLGVRMAALYFLLPVYGMFFGSVVMPLLVWALPITRRRAKVKSGHVVRAAGYGFLGVGLVFLSFGVVYSIALGTDGALAGSLVERWLWHAFPIWFVWFTLWWYFAIRRYMRLPHAIGILLVGVVMIICIGGLTASLSGAMEKILTSV